MAAYSVKRQLGNLGEDLACTYLTSKGFKIIARNYLKPWGELDIIAMKDDTYRFIEVKAISRETSVGHFAPNMTAEDHIHPAKLKKLARTVEIYMADVKGDYEYQVDVLTVNLNFATRKASCRLYEQIL